MVKRNLFIFVADALRFDYLPQSVHESGTTLKTLSPSLHTPVSFSSLITGLSPQNHDVRSFSDVLDYRHNTIFDSFPSDHASFFDHEEDPIRNKVFKHQPARKELDELEEPFIQVERAMETHTPYNEMHHGNNLEQVPDGDYTRSFGTDHQLKEKYREGVSGVEKHFWRHVDELEDRGIRDETLIVFTSDHGELLGDRINFKKRYAHGHPMCRQLVQVPTVFLDLNLDTNHMRTIDIPDTCLSFLNRQRLRGDGVNIQDYQPTQGWSLIEGYADYKVKWNYKRGEWRPCSALKLRAQILKNDLQLLLDKDGDNEDAFPELNNIDV